MERATALDQAVYLLRMPATVRQFRLGRLPADVTLLLRVLAGEEKARSHAVQICGKPLETVVEAAEFYVREILFAPDSTAYRVLGCEAHATREELRANMILMMRWLHPDTAGGSRDDDLFDRVGRAWRTMQSKQTRAAYDISLAEAWSLRQSLAESRAVAAAPLRSNPFLDRAPGSRKRRFLRRLIYLVALMAMALLVVAVLGYFGALAHFDANANLRATHPRALSPGDAPNFSGHAGTARVNVS
ncbi:MAG: J domain-containing protein [Rhodoblastus sp.]